MRRILGSNLPPALQAQARAMFVHRSTGDSRFDHGSPLQFSDDADWLAHTYFWVTAKGTLAKRASCESHPTWPERAEVRS